MTVIRIRHMGVCVHHGCVTVAMAVFALRGLIMHMGVMPVVMSVGMFMLEFFVNVLMTVRFRQVQHYAGQHQQAAQHHQGTE